MGCFRSGEETYYRGLVDVFLEWCGTNLVMLNVTTMREMVVDFRRNRTHLKKINTQSDEEHVVDDYN